MALSRDRLIDDLWGESPSDGAATTLRSYASRLRAALGSDRAVESLAGGYVLRVDPEAVDALRFDRLVKAGTAALDRRRYRSAARLLDDALAMWKPPFGDLATEGPLQAEAVRLEEQRVLALERRIEARLELGWSAELVAEVEALVAEQPHRERLWRHLMVALYRAHRQADALAAFHRAREALDNHLGIEPGPELQALQAAILRHEVDSPAVRRQELWTMPSPLTTFVGRDAEVGAIADLLLARRLVTLMGVGGSGKTRIAIETARTVQGRFADGAAFVDLAEIRDASHVPSLVASAIEAGPGPGDPRDRIAEAVRDAELLLILDNCEHLRDAVAAFAAWLLAHGPDLRILATSREVLGLPGEVARPIEPLGSPAADASIDEIRTAEAVRLLLDRIGFEPNDVSDETLRTAARICNSLEGLPLAIELAAGRSRVLSLDEIALRLHDRFQLLVSWRRLTSARHRTLREAMDWSFDLLAADEQRLLARLSVFPGDFTLASASLVCLDAADAEAERLLERLVDASLVVPRDALHATRYRLLETVREYATQQLEASERTDAQRRLAVRTHEIVESTNLASDTRGRGPRNFDLARAELPAIRASIAWSLEHDPTLGLEIACDLESFWTTDLPTEGLVTFDALLDRAGVPDVLRARALRCRAACRYELADFEGGQRDFEQALGLFRSLGMLPEAAHVTLRLAIVALNRGDPERASQLLAGAGAITESDRLPRDGYVALGLASELALRSGDRDRALELARQESDAAGAAVDDWWRADSLLRIAQMEIDGDRLDQAETTAREGLAVAHSIPDRRTILPLLACLARIAALKGDPRQAGRLWGGIEAEVAREGRDRLWELEAHGLRARVAAEAGAAFEPAVAEGRALPFADVIAEALGPA